jgi:hypothetical protein
MIFYLLMRQGTDEFLTRIHKDGSAEYRRIGQENPIRFFTRGSAIAYQFSIPDADRRKIVVVREDEIKSQNETKNAFF